MTLQEWMDAKGLKDRQVAALLEGALSRSQVSRIRRFGTTSLPTAQMLSKKLRLPVQSFARREDG
jgi:transcriptional regulator with XRE-family HTH domain